ncbi:50S ribosomal protein L22 [Blattabacterium cuenoti]|uniref:50S ribosomal protein L22 n=1 Tax=Blattabacterium cuenoti TaxID=1653831 RepID=UPI00163C2C12|nr:50S ribosomal protein L22 [Blattabacterium cuenoti]
MEQKISMVSASLNGVRISPRKMRLVADLIRNKEIQKALSILEYSSKKRVSYFFRKLLLSLLSNWKRKYEQLEDINLYINKIVVNQGKTLKRLRPVPQGRGHRIRKRSSNISVFLGKNKK